MAKSNASGLLTSLDSLFTTQEQRDAAKRDVVLDLPLDQIGDFPNHPFKVRQDDAMMEMMESVQLHGVLVPGLVRQLADGSYQICLLYTSDAADDSLRVDLGGRRIIKKIFF